MKNEHPRGQGVVEYALIVLLIGIAALLAMQLMGISVSGVFCKVAAGFGATSCTGQTAYCSDSFNNLASSQVVNGSWTAANGQVCNAGGGGIIYNACSMNSMTAADYTAQISGAALAGGPGYGIFFRASNSGLGTNGYAFQFDPGLGGFVVRKWVNGVEINPPLAYKSTPGFNYYGTAHTLSVKVVGNTFTGLVDGVPMLSGTDSTYTSGGAGVRTWGATNLCMDSFSVLP